MKVFFGAAGFSKEAYWLYRRQQEHAQKSFDDIDYFVVADNEILSDSKLYNIPLIHELELFEKRIDRRLDAYIAVSSPSIRRKIIEKILSYDVDAYFPTLIDPSVIMDDKNIVIGQGAVICAGTILTTDIKIGEFVHINLDCTVGHDTTISDFSTLSPGCHISGNVKLSENTFCGTGTVIIENISVVNDVVLGAGSLVIKNIIEAGVYVGIPAKRVR